MKATEFCKFFDFDITAQSPSDNEEVTHRYAVLDNNGTFSTIIVIPTGNLNK